jgi:hypothetical protein
MSNLTPINHDSPCSALIRLQEKMSNISDDVDQNKKDIRPLIELAAQIKLLMSLSIGGGFLALVNLALFVVNSFR